MRTTVLFLGAVTATLALACTPASSNGTRAASSTDAAANTSDPDVTPTGAGGVPSGYQGRVDRANAQLSAVKYVPAGQGWEVTTGPAHITYLPTSRATGDYTATTTIQQLAAPTHREAFGLLFGGSNLDTPAQRYTYFVVAGTGEGTVRERNGETVRSLIAWEKNPHIPAADSAGRATYRIQVRVKGDSIRFLVNNGEFARLNKRELSMQTDGVVGLRINHNLKLQASPVAITRP